MRGPLVGFARKKKATPTCVIPRTKRVYGLASAFFPPFSSPVSSPGPAKTGPARDKAPVSILDPNRVAPIPLVRLGQKRHPNLQLERHHAAKNWTAPRGLQKSEILRSRGTILWAAESPGRSWGEIETTEKNCGPTAKLKSSSKDRWDKRRRAKPWFTKNFRETGGEEAGKRGVHGPQKWHPEDRRPPAKTGPAPQDGVCQGALGKPQLSRNCKGGGTGP